jgi:hypothetical protein
MLEFAALVAVWDEATEVENVAGSVVTGSRTPPTSPTGSQPERSVTIHANNGSSAIPAATATTRRRAPEF